MQRLVLAFIIVGLALEAVLWSVPAMVTVTAVARGRPTAVARQRPTETASPRLPEALTGLLNAEVDALRVAGLALDQPTTPGLGERADRAGAAVLAATRAYADTFASTVADPAQVLRWGR